MNMGLLAAILSLSFIEKNCVSHGETWGAFSTGSMSRIVGQDAGMLSSPKTSPPAEGLWPKPLCRKDPHKNICIKYPHPPHLTHLKALLSQFYNA